jgi:hypothetical protein
MPPDPKPPKSVHGYTGDTTPAEDEARAAPDHIVSPEEAVRIAEEASRAEDA